MTTELNALRALINRIPSSAHGAAKATEILTNLEKEAIGIGSLTNNPDPMKSPAANSMVLNQQKDRLRDLIAKSRGQLSEIVVKAKQAFEADRVEKSKLRPSEHAAEIRTVFRGLSDPDKGKFILDATKAGDAASVAAIVTVPSVLTGLSAERIAQYREHFLDAMVPGSKAQRDTTDNLESVVQTSISVIEKMAQPVN